MNTINNDNKVNLSFPKSWEFVVLSEVCFIIMGQSPPSKYYNTDGKGLPFFQGKTEFGDLYPTIIKWCDHPNKIAENKDILISVRAPVGPTNLAPSKCCIGRGLAAIRPILPDTPAKFILYYLKCIESEIVKLGTGTTFKAISGKILNDLAIPLAPINEQKRIVSEIEKQFSRLDEAEENLKRVKANLKRYKASVLKAAVEGKLTEQWRAENPDVEPASELLDRLLTERRKKWEEAELAKMKAKGTVVKNEKWKKRFIEPVKIDSGSLENLPDHWCWAHIEDLGKVQLGRQRAPRYHSGPNMRPYLRVQNVFEDRIDLEDVMEMDFPPSDFKKYKLEYGDILLNEGQSPELLGRPAIYRGELPNACFTNTLIRFRAAQPISPEFPLLVFRSYMHSGRFTKAGTITTNIAHLSAGRFSKIEFPVPPLLEQEKIIAESNRRLSIIDSFGADIDRAIMRATRLRQSILTRAFSGNLVPQDPNDEPASKLLERIKAEREKAGKKRKKKKGTGIRRIHEPV